MARKFEPDRLADWPPGERTFIAALVRFQDSESLTDEMFSQRLGISKTLWRKTRRGYFRLGFKLWVAGRDLAGYQVATAAHETVMKRAGERCPRRVRAA